MEEIIYITTPTLPKTLEKDCYILSTSLDDDFLTSFINLANSLDKITLFFGDNEQAYAKRFGASGIILDQTMTLSPITDLTPIRKALGKDAFIGLITRNRRHETMLSAELEPDFIIFKAWEKGLDKTTELLNWYNDFFLIQSALFPQDKISYNQIPADFIIIPL